MRRVNSHRLLRIHRQLHATNTSHINSNYMLQTHHTPTALPRTHKQLLATNTSNTNSIAEDTQAATCYKHITHQQHCRGHTSSYLLQTHHTPTALPRTHKQLLATNTSHTNSIAEDTQAATCYKHIKHQQHCRGHTSSYMLQTHHTPIALLRSIDILSDVTKCGLYVPGTFEICS